ncbi:RNA-binding protein [Pseudoclavibacter helvolus]|uniref:RNA-binding protein n=1 Tax=Pseudoclavibacter helvolus TaxID=255205 RepID=UPI003C77FD7E
MLLTNGPAPRLLVPIEAPRPSSVAAYTAPLRFLGDEQIAVLAPSDISHLLEGDWTAAQLLGRELPHSLREIRTVFSAGSYLPAGELAYEWSRALRAQFVVAQHGLMTPLTPPLARDAHLLAFSEADAGYWKSGRGDVSHEVVGAQILWNAARRRRAEGAAVDAKPVFLGQLHGAELPRRISAATSQQFCRETGAEYRPHPSETDRLSRMQHQAWRRRGVEFESSGLPLGQLHRPVVSIFSTGVLEAAAAGEQAWVTCVNPPDWILDFWERYGLSQWGEQSTPAPHVPQTEPAKLIAASLARILEGAA